MLYGIDLGTTNSCISFYKGEGVSEIIVMEDGERLLPSCVMLEEDGSFTVGVKAFANRFSSSVASSTKRLIGTDAIITLTNGKLTKILKPEDIAVEILRTLVKRVSHIHTNVKDVTITVPAAFNSKQRELTKWAGEQVGLNVVAIVNEPTAAALVGSVCEDGTVLVYDLGGGTFDATVLKVTGVSQGGLNLNFEKLGLNLAGTPKKERTYAVVASEGNTHLGGDDLDEIVLELTKKQLQKRLNSKKLEFDDIFKESVSQRALYEIAVRKAYILELMTATLKFKVRDDEIVEKYLEDVEFLRDKDGSIYLNIEKDFYIEATKIIYKKTRDVLQRILQSAPSDLNRIVLVGGSTENPILREIIKKDFPDLQVIQSVKAFEVIGLGASVQTAISMGQTNSIITDVTTINIGVVVLVKNALGDLEEKVQNIVPKNSKLPFIARERMSLHNNGTELKITIVEGDGYSVSNCSKIGELTLNRLEETSFVDLMVRVNTSGICSFFVTDGQVETQVELKGLSFEEPKSSFSEEELKRSIFLDRLRKRFAYNGIKITKAMETHFNSYLQTGNEKDMESIQKRLTKSNNFTKGDA